LRKAILLEGLPLIAEYFLVQAIIAAGIPIPELLATIVIAVTIKGLVFFCKKLIAVNQYRIYTFLIGFSLWFNTKK